VIDASVVVKWVLSGEPYEEKADAVQAHQVSGNAELWAPSFLVQEVTNAIWRAIKLKRITQEIAEKSLKSLDGIQITFCDFSWTEACDVLKIATNLDLTVYDAAYLFLSEKINSPIITADDKMYQKAKGQFRVVHLKDYT
jgi:predicted nucleic acid-binding protein